MSGFSIKLEPLLKAHPSEAEAIHRLEALLRDAANERQRKRWNLDRLCDLVEPRSRDEFSLILGELVRTGILDHEIQVESPSTHIVVGRFRDLSEVPVEIHDKSTDLHIPVSPED